MDHHPLEPVIEGGNDGEPDYRRLGALRINAITKEVARAEGQSTIIFTHSGDPADDRAAVRFIERR